MAIRHRNRRQSTRLFALLFRQLQYHLVQSRTMAPRLIGAEATYGNRNPGCNLCDQCGCLPAIRVCQQRFLIAVKECLANGSLFKVQIPSPCKQRGGRRQHRKPDVEATNFLPVCLGNTARRPSCNSDSQPFAGLGRRADLKCLQADGFAHFDAISPQCTPGGRAAGLAGFLKSQAAAAQKRASTAVQRKTST